MSEVCPLRSGGQAWRQRQARPAHLRKPPTCGFRVLRTRPLSLPAWLFARWLVAAPSTALPSAGPASPWPIIRRPSTNNTRVQHTTGRLYRVHSINPVPVVPACSEPAAGSRYRTLGRHRTGRSTASTTPASAQREPSAGAVHTAVCPCSRNLAASTPVAI